LCGNVITGVEIEPDFVEARAKDDAGLAVSASEKAALIRFQRFKGEETNLLNAFGAHQQQLQMASLSHQFAASAAAAKPARPSLRCTGNPFIAEGSTVPDKAVKNQHAFVVEMHDSTLDVKDAMQDVEDSADTVNPELATALEAAKGAVTAGVQLCIHQDHCLEIAFKQGFKVAEAYRGASLAHDDADAVKSKKVEYVAPP